MAITKEVNVHLLNECFELRPFHGLCKPHPNDVLTPPNEDDEERNDENIEGEYMFILLFYSFSFVNEYIF